MSLNTAEAIAAALVVVPGALVTCAYALDRVGLPFQPWAMLVAGLSAGLGTLVFALGRARRDVGALAAFVAIVGGAFGWLLWIARPALLPLGTGPDLTHHLLLIRYIEQHWRLVHDAGVEPLLGEMVHYTPGSHILAALAGVWSGTDGLRMLHAVLAATVALKAGFVFLIVLRMLPQDVPRTPMALMGALSLFASQTFFLGSFVEYSFVAQVVAELFAVAMWWALTVWDAEPDPVPMVFLGITGAAVFLTWPVLIGPPLLALALLVLLPRTLSFRARVASASLALLPIAAFAGLFVSGRTAWIQIAGTGGKTAWPVVSAYGWPFLVVSTIGLAISPWRRQSRTTGLFTLAMLAQTAALYWLARRDHNVPYMALKMFYLLLSVQAAGVGLAMGATWRLVGGMVRGGRTGHLRSGLSPGAQSPLTPAGIGRHPDVPETRLAWVAVAVLGVLVARPLRGAPQSLVLEHRPAISRPLALAGEWARVHVPSNCVEYLVGDDETAYWLHLAVLGNPRMSARTGDNATYELVPALVRWLTPGGLPYAIADLPSLPRDVRQELDVIQQFDSAAVAKRRGPSSCPAEH